MKWFDTFTATARELNVPEPVITEVAAEVREKSDDPVIDYGDPALYARALADTVPQRPTGAEVVLASLGPLAGVLGWQFATRGVQGMLDGADVAITTGDLLWWAALLAGTVAVVAYFTGAMRKGILLAAGLVALAGLALLASLYLTGEVWTMTALVSLAGGVLFLVVSVVLWWRYLQLRPTQDRLAQLAPWTFVILTALQAAAIAVLS